MDENKRLKELEDKGADITFEESIEYQSILLAKTIDREILEKYSREDDYG